MNQIGVPDREDLKITEPVQPMGSEKQPTVKAKAVFKKPGQVTSREQRAKAVSVKRDQIFTKKKSRQEHRAYAIDYTKQEDHLKASSLKRPAGNGWSPKRFKRYPRFTIFLNNSKWLFNNLNSD